MDQKPILALLTATFAVSFAAIFIRMSDAHAFTIAFWRLLFATIVMFVVGTAVGETDDLKELRLDRDFGILVVSGFFLAIHFGSWTLSLEYTSVAASVTLVDSSPLIVVILSSILLKEFVSRNQIIGILLAVVGAIIIGIADSSGGDETLYGDILALIGAGAVAIYLVIGRTARSKLSTFSYVVVVYGTCAIFLLLTCLAMNTQLFMLDLSEYFLFLLLALGPSCLGHSLYNYALGHLRAPIVSTATLGEVIGSTILAALIFDEIPGFFFIVGAIFLLLGVILTLEPWKDFQIQKNINGSL
ncbi:MAG: DMT family transporter [Asgard group archaeon]|nr:DMT family transporter [Asgard group archaeon]